MRITSTVAYEFGASGLRLDASYYASSGVQTMHLLERWKQNGKQRNFDRLIDVCSSKGIFIPGRFSRVYVSDAEHGLLWLSPSDMLKADLSDLPYVSKKYTPFQDALRLQKGWLLLSRSGSIGNLAYVRDDMVEMLGSDDIIRILPNPTKILSGYLFAFLSSAMGKALIQQQTYGAVIQHIESEHIVDLPIPRLDSTVEQHIHAFIERATDFRVQANKLLDQAKIDLEHHLGFSKPKHSFDHSFALGTAAIDPNFGIRLDSFCYVGYVQETLEVLERYPKIVLAKDVGYEFFNPPIFKRIFAESGYPYMSAVNFYILHPRPERYLSRMQPNIHQYLVRKGMVIMQNAGQRYGLITKPLFITDTLDGVAVTSDVIRISHNDPIENGYFCGLFSTDFGRRLALRYSYGTSIPRLDVPKFSMVKIPYPEDQFRRKIGQMVVDAYDYREQANKLENQAQTILVKALEG